MDKSEWRFDLDRDFNATRDSIWLLKIRFRPTGFGIQLDLRIFLRFDMKLQDLGTKTNVYAACVLVGPFPFHFINPVTAGQEVLEHSDNICQRRTPLQCCASNQACSQQQTIGIYSWVTTA